MSDPIKVIDLFAGPGGLGEGFSAYRFKNKQRFKIALSIEKETSAHQTLLLRAFFRQFDNRKLPDEYYAFLRGELGEHPEAELYRITKLRQYIENAHLEAQQMTLGETAQRVIYEKIRYALQGENFILIGGPPCQAYSLVGRARNYGAKDKEYSATEDNRNFLYKEYLRIIANFQPLVFVMENVKGLLSAKIDGELIFDAILRDLKDPCKAVHSKPVTGHKHKYRIYSFVQPNGQSEFFNNLSHPSEPNPQQYVIRSEEYGIPQARHRVILLGIREDHGKVWNGILSLEKSTNTPTVKQVISDLPAIRSKLSKEEDTTENWRSAILSMKREIIPSLKKDHHVTRELMEKLINYLNDISRSPESVGKNMGMTKMEDLSQITPELRSWYQDKRLGNYIINHESRGHIITDLYRYLYYSTCASINRISPKSHNLPEVLWPEHKNFDSGKFSDRFRVQIADAPATTITSHISKDGHYYIHYDPVQCRSLTVREAARIQTFPDNYFFVGNRTQQYVQVGNAVPPYLAYQIAKIVYELLGG